jgi:hypothetical protein
MTDTAAASNGQSNLNNVVTGGACLVDWELYGTRITPDALRATLVAHGYDPAVVPDIPQDQRVRSAGARWTQGRGNADRYRAEVTEDDDSIYVQVLRRADAGTVGTAGKAARRKFTPVASLVWTKTQPATVIDPAVPGQWATDVWFAAAQASGNAATVMGAPSPSTDPLVRAALDACRKACDTSRLHHDHEFIRPVCIVAPLKAMGAVPFIRRSGGCMVVPMQHIDDLRQLQGLVASLGDSYMGVVRADVTDTGTVQAMQRSVRDSLTTDVQSVRDDLQAWRARGKRIPTGALGDRLNKFGEIRDRAQLYADALGMVVADLLTDIDDAQADARDLLDIAMGRKPATPPATSVPAEALADAPAHVAAVM